MKKILSKETCDSLIRIANNQEWERIDRYGKYYQTFITDSVLQNQLENYFGKEFLKPPILKILKFEKGDSIPTFSADYSNMTDEYYKRYVDTNFIIQIYLNSTFDGGCITKIKETYLPNIGYGITQNKTEKCNISEIKNGTAYFLFAFISEIKTESLI